MHKFWILLLVFVYHVNSAEVTDISTDDGDSPLQILKQMLQELNETAKKGAKELRELMSSGYINNQLKKLSSFYRSIANRILNSFADILLKLEEEVRPTQRYSSIELVQSEDTPAQLDSILQSFGLFNNFMEVVMAIELKVRDAQSKGREALKSFLESSELVNTLSKLPRQVANLIRSWIKKTTTGEEVLNEKSNFENDKRSEAFQIMWIHILEQGSQGHTKLQNFVENKEFDKALSQLSEEERIELLELIRDLSKSSPNIEKRSSDQVFDKLQNMKITILNLAATGTESLEAYIKTAEFVKSFYELTEDGEDQIRHLVFVLTFPFERKPISQYYSKEYIKLRKELFDTYLEGDEALANLINSKDFSGILEGLDDMEKRSLKFVIDQLTNKRNQRMTRAVYSREYLDLRSRIFASYSKGNDFFQKFLSGEGFAETLKGLAATEKQEIEELILQLSGPIQARSARAYYSNEYLDLRSRILASHSKGNEFLLKLLKSNGFNDVLTGLNQQEKKEIDELIEELTLSVQDRKARSYYSKEYLDLRSRILSSHSRGVEVLDRFLSSKGFVFFFESLKPTEKLEIQELIQQITEPKGRRALRSDFSRQYLDLRSRILASHAKGNLSSLIQSLGFIEMTQGLRINEKEEINELILQLLRVD